jgi:hypothetical protein
VVILLMMKVQPYGIQGVTWDRTGKNLTQPAENRGSRSKVTLVICKPMHILGQSRTGVSPYPTGIKLKQDYSDLYDFGGSRNWIPK